LGLIAIPGVELDLVGPAHGLEGVAEESQHRSGVPEITCIIRSPWCVTRRPSSPALLPKGEGSLKPLSLREREGVREIFVTLFLGAAH
jgi:hypothetical protein